MDGWTDNSLDVRSGPWASASRIQAQDGGRSERQEDAARKEYFLCPGPCAAPSFMKFNIY